MLRNAIRLQTAADLYYGALLKSADDGNARQFDGYIARFGWLTSKVALLWEGIRKARKESSGQTLDAILNKGGEDGD
jgi:hypothetical protein